MPWVGTIISTIRALTDYYKGKLTESALLDKAWQVATKVHVLLDDKKILQALKQPQLTELLQS